MSEKSKNLSTRERFRRKMNSGAFERGSGGLGSEDFIKLNDGKNYIRILPPKSLNPAKDDWYIDRLRHFGVGPDNRVVICPKTEDSDNKCAACKRSDALKAAGEKKEAGQLGARMAFIMNAIEINPKNGELVGNKAKLFTPGKMIMNEIGVYYDDDQEWGDPWGENCGKKGVAYDFIITKSGSGLETEYQVKPTRLFQDTVNPASLLKSLHDLQAEFPIPSSDEMQKIFLGEDDDGDDEEEKPAKKGKRSKKVEEEDEDEEAADVDEEEDEDADDEGDEEEEEDEDAGDDGDDDADEEADEEDEEEVEDDEESDEDEEEEEEEPAEEEDEEAEEDEDEGDEPEDEDEEEAEEDEEEEEEAPAKRAPRGRKSKPASKPAPKSAPKGAKGGKRAGNKAALEEKMKAAFKKGRK